MDVNSEPRICTFCLKGVVKYTCPRCNVQYCCSECYKSEAHSECSENFYKECFVEGLKDLESSKDERSRIMEMLSRVQGENQSEDEEESGLAERIKGIDLDKDIDKVWSVLTVDEKREFDSMLKDGRMGNLLKSWSPWWNSVSTKVEEVNRRDDKRKCVPIVKTNIADINDLLKFKEPSPELCFNVVNVLYGYAYLCQLYNGEHHEVSRQVVQDVQKICGTFQKLTYPSVAEAILSCIMSLQNECKDVAVSQEFSVAVLSDVIKIIKGPSLKSVDYILASLSDLHALFGKAKRQLSSDKKYKKGSSSIQLLKEEKLIVFGNEKKLEFILSFVKSYGGMIDVYIGDLELLFCELSSNLKQHSAAEEVIKRNEEPVRILKHGKQKLVEEI